MKKINFKQPRYIFPLIVLLPFVFVTWQIASMFGANEENKVTAATDELNLSLPDAKNKELGSKLHEMQERYRNNGFDNPDADMAALLNDSIYPGANGEVADLTDEELNAIIASLGSNTASNPDYDSYQKSMKEVQEQAEAFRQSLVSNSSPSYSSGYNSAEADLADYQREMEELAEQTRAKQRIMQEAFGLTKPQATEPAPEAPKQVEIPKPVMVLKSPSDNANRFHSINSDETVADNALIKAMIDKTTKASDGTRLRFKLLDDVTIPDRNNKKEIKLKKGTYLYGTVTGFKQQRVLANITSILVGDKFITVDLSVYDNDGMQGFYVPESAFREFVKNASSSAVQSNINISGGYGQGVSGEMLALQALQNVYSSASSALSQNLRKNKATIKYNTIVYLINSNDVY